MGDVLQLDKEVFGKINEQEERAKQAYIDSLSEDYEHKYEENINDKANTPEPPSHRTPDKRAISVLAKLETHSTQLKKTIARNIVRTMQQREDRKSPDLRFRAVSGDSGCTDKAHSPDAASLSRSREKPTHRVLARESMQAGRNILTLFNVERANKGLHGYKPYKSSVLSHSTQFISNNSEGRLRENVDFAHSGKMYETELVAHSGTRVRLIRRVKL